MPLSMWWARQKQCQQQKVRRRLQKVEVSALVHMDSMQMLVLSLSWLWIASAASR